MLGGVRPSTIGLQDSGQKLQSSANFAGIYGKQRTPDREID